MLNRRGARPYRRMKRPFRASLLLELQQLEGRDLLSTSVQLGTNFAGLDFNTSRQLSGQGVEPPDTNVAVGPTFLVETVNTAVAVYNKSDGSLVSQTDLRQFFGPVSPTGDLFDPIVSYDDLSGRFVVAVLEQIDFPQQSYLDFAVSNSSDPTQGFGEMHRLNALRHDALGRAVHADYPTVGRNGTAYVFTVNMYTFATPTVASQFDHVQVISVSKASVLDADPSTLTAFQVDRPPDVDFSLSAAAMHDTVAGDPMWFVEEDQSGSTGLSLVRMTNVLSPDPSFTETDVPVPAYSQAISPAQPGGRLFASDALDSRILNVTLRGNTLVADHTISVGSDDHARWYEFDLSGTPRLVQSGDIDRGAGVNTFLPAIDIAPSGQLGMAFEESSGQEPMSVYVTGRDPSDASGSMATPVPVKRGLQAYNGSAGGDFSGISIDPSDGSFWGGAEFANQEATNWGTWVARLTLKVTAPPVPTIPPATLAAVGGDAAPTVVFAITEDHAMYRHDVATGWSRIGGSGTAVSIAAAMESGGNAVVFMVTTDHALYRYDPASGWAQLGGPGSIGFASAGTDAQGRADVYVLTSHGDFAEFSQGAGWQILGASGTVLWISGTSMNRVFVVTADHSVFEFDAAVGWSRASGANFASTVSAAPDGAVYALTLDHGLQRFRPETGWTLVGGPGTIDSVSAGAGAGGDDAAFVQSTAGDVLTFAPVSGWAVINPSQKTLALSGAEADQAFAVAADHSVIGHDPAAGWYPLTSPGFALG